MTYKTFMSIILLKEDWYITNQKSKNVLIDLFRKLFFILLWFSVYIFEKSSFISFIYYLYLHLHDHQRGFRIYRESKWCEIDRSIGFLNCWLKYILLYNLNAFTVYEFSKIYPTKIRFKNFWKGQHFKNPCGIDSWLLDLLWTHVARWHF